jgi:hypothetical protein
MSRLSAALKYLEMGFSIIPVNSEKKPILDWSEYQKRPPTKEEVERWWHNRPDANIGIVTGAVSNLCVLDADSKKGRQALETVDPDIEPYVQTPKGWHFYFKYLEGIRNATRFLPDCDIRGEGGYVVAPPSVNGGGGKYKQLKGLAFIPTLSHKLEHVIHDSANTSTSSFAKTVPANATTATNRNKRNIIFNQGGRDETLFHIANCLERGGMCRDNILETIGFIGEHCDPPFPRKDIEAKIASVENRAKKVKNNLTAELREFVTATWGNFSATEGQQSVTNATFPDAALRKKIRVIFGRFVDEGLIERVPGKNGVYRKIDKDCQALDWKNACSEQVHLKMPLGLDRLVELHPGDIVTLMGSQNAGKTAVAMNMAMLNMRDWNVHYFSSEMGAEGFKRRVEKYQIEGIPVEDWTVQFYQRVADFSDVIKPGKGNLNIIDYLEIYDNFYRVAGLLANIHEKLDGALAVICLQKNPGQDIGRGGSFSLEKARLSLSIDYGVVKIVKLKTWAENITENPNGKMCGFKIINGTTIKRVGNWRYPEPKE